MTAAAIPLTAVRQALMCAVIKRKTAGREVGGLPHARTAAYTQYPFWLPVCGERRVRLLPNHFGVMDHGRLDVVLERTRLQQGLAGVRNTWGAGMRTLQAEFAQGCLR